MNESESQVLGNPPEYAQGVAALASWSGNYDHPSPYTLFCDLIGFSGEEYGGAMFVPTQDPYTYNGHEVPRLMASLIDAQLGFAELGMLADALAEYAERPQDVTAYVRLILEAGQEDES